MNKSSVLDPKLVSALGDELYEALRGGLTLEPLSRRHPNLTIDDAYHVSLRMLERRVAAGERVIGKKIGVTSKPVQQMLDVHQPDFGFLTNAMQYANGATISIQGAGLIQPRAEGEIAFILKEDLVGARITREDVLDATAAVSPCFEIVDSRIEDWKIRIQDTVADNASCGVFVLGEARADANAVDLASVQLDMFMNGEQVASGKGEAVQGHPAEAVAWLANTLGRFGIPFLAGEIILSGSLVPLIPAVAGNRFELDIRGIGSAAVSFTA